MEWRVLTSVGYHNYRVSDTGIVERIDLKRGPRAVAQIDNNGYRWVSLWKANRSRTFYVHQLVLTAFIGACPEGKQCRHRNGIRDDNRLQNLRWGTPKKNAGDRTKHGRTIRGEQFWSAKATEGQVRRVRRLYETGNYTMAAVARKIKLPEGIVQAIVNGKTWKHVK